MKDNKFTFLTVTGLLVVILFIFSVMAQIKNNSFDSEEGLQINVSSSKDSYVLGETVFFNFEVKNNSSKDIRVRGLDLSSNYVSVYISYEGDVFKKYKHSRVKEGNWWMFKPGQTVNSKSGILWNFSPLETSTANAWEELAKTHIFTYYAFPKPGTYSIKAILGIPSAENPITVESKPIQITIEDPVGEDLEVWNIIKDRNELGFFIQENDFRSHAKSQEIEKLQREIEQIVTRYPKSVIANQVKQSLEKFRAVEEKIKADREKMKKP